MTRRAGRVAAQCLVLGACLLASPVLRAGAFGVTPIRLDFDESTRTGAIAVTSDDAERLAFQMKLFEWSQDAAGKDVYKESKDLIFFPTVMTVEPKGKRIIRVGTRSPPGPVERTYRLFVEELPDPNAERGKGAQVTVKLRFGVPLFVAPAEPELRGSIDKLLLEAGTLKVRVRNTGNRHFRPEKIIVEADGKPVGETPGWYILAGATRTFEVELDPAACSAPKLAVSLSGDGLTLKKDVAVSPSLCRR